MTENEIKLINQIMNDLDNFVSNKYNIYSSDIRKFITNQKRRYGLLPKYQTLREYIRKHSIGAYHKFIFNIGLQTVNVIDVSDFESYFKPEILDEYVVERDETKSYGASFQYECNHFLTIKKKEEE